MANLTYRYRLKEGNTAKQLCIMAGSVNFVWNFCNEVVRRKWSESRKLTDENQLQALTKGSSKLLPINSQTIQGIFEELLLRVRKVKRVRWRTAKKNLGWIPFKGQTIKFCGDYIVYDKKEYRLWQHRPLPKGAVIKEGSFSQDARGRWYVNLVLEMAETKPLQPAPEGSEVGIDPGMKTVLSLSNGEKYRRANLTKEYEKKLKNAQRRGKKRQVKKLHARIANSRLDFNHKASFEIAKNHSLIFFGDAKSSKMAKTKMAKSVHDAGWYQIKTFLGYKAIRRQGRFFVQNEQNSTVTCSSCLTKTGPSGLSGLGVREWECSVCETVHDRDVNAAQNILRLGRETLRVSGGNAG